jgi:response regulator RpfG family c-di-GMP phosphodiesterase
MHRGRVWVDSYGASLALAFAPRPFTNNKRDNHEQAILVVEHQEDNLQILRDLLGSVGYEIIEARDGAGGVKAAKTERPDLF